MSISYVYAGVVSEDQKFRVLLTQQVRRVTCVFKVYAAFETVMAAMKLFGVNDSKTKTR